MPLSFETMLDPRKVVDGSHGVQGALEAPSASVAAIVAFTALNWAYSVELNVRILGFFRVYRGLYFWSMIIASWSCFFYGLGIISKFFEIIPNIYVNVSLIYFGWATMVTGQSVVMYSRLHLVVRNPKKIRWILYMIIFDGLILCVPTGVLVYGSNSAEAATFAPIYTVYEKIQVTAFCIQEFLISAVYINETHKMLRPGQSFRTDRLRQILYNLIFINIAIIAMDLTILGTEYAGLYDVQTPLKGAIYAFKLRLEFDILNQLMQTLDRRTTRTSSSPGEKAGYQSHPYNCNLRQGTNTNCWSLNPPTSKLASTAPMRVAANLVDKVRHGAEGTRFSTEEKDFGNIEMTMESIVTSQDQDGIVAPLPSPHYGTPIGAPISPLDGDVSDKDAESIERG